MHVSLSERLAVLIALTRLRTYTTYENDYCKPNNASVSITFIITFKMLLLNPFFNYIDIHFFFSLKKQTKKKHYIHTREAINMYIYRKIFFEEAMKKRYCYINAYKKEIVKNSRFNNKKVWWLATTIKNKALMSVVRKIMDVW